MKKDGYELITVAKEEDGNPIPEGIVKLGGQSKHEYEMLLAYSKALLGIGLPQISPSPYNALCAGVPVVMPFWKKAPPGRGWHEFAM
jgi:alpha-1,3(6)-mannosylglycoprotein beta-1,6-N-acetyl-glucosaminyltransferase